MTKSLVVYGLLGVGLSALLPTTMNGARWAPPTDQAAAVTRTDGLTVSGTTMVRVQPTVAYLILGLGSNEATADTAKENSLNSIDGLKADLMKEGVKEADFEVTMEHFTDMRRSSVGVVDRPWNHTAYVQITIRDVKNAPHILDVALASRRASLSRFEYGVEDDSVYWRQARESAAKIAKEKAEQHARNLGLTLGPIIRVSEQIPGSWDYSERNSHDTRGDGLLTEDDVREQIIGKGTLSYTVKLNVTYSLK